MRSQTNAAQPLRATPPQRGPMAADVETVEGLRARWLAAALAVRDARHEGRTAAALAFALSPDVPIAIEDPSWPGMPLTRAELERDPDCTKAGLIEIRDRWLAELDAVNRVHGLREKEAATGAAEADLASIAARLAAIRPTTIEEASWRLEAIIGLPEDDEEAALPLVLAREVLKDMQRLGRSDRS